MDLIRHPAHARAFLERARSHLARFDGSRDASAVFYAALELRFGIEARLYDYLKPTLKELGRDGPTGYQASKLLKELHRTQPRSKHTTALRFVNEQSGDASPTLWYTPVTPELASDHGRLGNLLHFKFFERHAEWLLDTETGADSLKTLVDWRRYLGEVAERLEGACRGTLLTNATFTALVDDLTEPGSEDEEP